MRSRIVACEWWVVGRLPSRSPIAYLRFTVCSLLATILLTGCYQRMADQPRIDPYEPFAYFPDSQGVRPIPPGTVPRGDLAETMRLSVAGDAYPDAAGPFAPPDAPGPVAPRLADAFPFPVTAEVLARGRQEFEIDCAPCHGRTGYGNGPIVRRGLRTPPSFHTDRLRTAPVGHFVDVIANGYGAMYSYADRVEPSDRWAIAAYLRALQRSQHATAADLPPDTLARLTTRPLRPLVPPPESAPIPDTP